MKKVSFSVSFFLAEAALSHGPPLACPMAPHGQCQLDPTAWLASSQVEPAGTGPRRGHHRLDPAGGANRGADRRRGGCKLACARRGVRSSALFWRQAPGQGAGRSQRLNSRRRSRRERLHNREWPARDTIRFMPLLDEAATRRKKILKWYITPSVAHFRAPSKPREVYHGSSRNEPI